MKQAIVDHGGKVFSNFSQKETTHVFAANDNDNLFLRAKKWNKDIYSQAWLNKCISCGEVVKPSPFNLLFMTDETQRQFKHEFDEYGKVFACCDCTF